MDNNQIKTVLFTWNSAKYPPEDFIEPVLVQTNKDRLLVFKDTMAFEGGDISKAHSGWDFLVRKYNIKYWIYQKNIII